MPPDGDLDSLVARTRPHGLLVDTNLLLVWVVGSCNPRLLGRFARTSAYDEESFDLLARFLDLYPVILTTPNVLTEVGNLAGTLKRDLSGHLARTVSAEVWGLFAKKIEVLREDYVPSAKAVTDRHFPKVGLTDAAIVQAAVARQCLVLTDDATLAQILGARGVPVINFNHLRAWNWRLRT
jgi:rRNA-processing protein FCF1